MEKIHFGHPLAPIAIATACSILFLLGRRIALRAIQRWTSRNKVKISGTFVSALRAPSICWAIALAAYIGLAFSGLEPRVAKPIYQAISISLILSASFVLGNFAVLLFNTALQRTSHQSSASGLSLAIVRGSFIGLGGLASLSVLGISIAPLLTALGVGGLAVALALKDTLENFFAGIYLITDRTLRVGDYVKLENGQEGMVDDIGWRTSKVVTLSDTTVILPNSKLAQSVIINYSLPNRKFCLSIPFTVGLEADPFEVEELLLDVAKKASEDIVGVMANPEPCVRLNPGVGHFSIELSLNVTISDFPVASFVRHELRKRVHARFREEGIPLPTRLAAPTPFPAPMLSQA